MLELQVMNSELLLETMDLYNQNSFSFERPNMRWSNGVGWESEVRGLQLRINKLGILFFNNAFESKKNTQHDWWTWWTRSSDRLDEVRWGSPFIFIKIRNILPDITKYQIFPPYHHKMPCVSYISRNCFS